MKQKKIVRIPRTAVENCIKLLEASGKNTKQTVKTILTNWLCLSDYTDDYLDDSSQKQYEAFITFVNQVLEVEDWKQQELIAIVDELIDRIKKAGV